MTTRSKIGIIGAGNIGCAMAEGLVGAGLYTPGEMILTRRHLEHLDDLAERGFQVTSDNREAVRSVPVVVLAVEPHHLNGVLHEIGPDLDPERHVLISVVSGAGIDDILSLVEADVPVVRAMPNTAIALRESMTCLSTRRGDEEALETADRIFATVGRTLVIDEELMVPATALCACGVAFFLRAVRAACQGGIEIGFHPSDALALAAQTALGAAALVREHGHHPEAEIDSVTTPRGCTISGLNEMEHRGFSSALIKGITTSATKADSLYASE